MLLAVTLLQKDKTRNRQRNNHSLIFDKQNSRRATFAYEGFCLCPTEGLKKI